MFDKMKMGTVFVLVITIFGMYVNYPLFTKNPKIYNTVLLPESKYPKIQYFRIFILLFSFGVLKNINY